MIEEKVKSIFVNTTEQLNSCVEYLSSATEITLDLEFDKNRLRYGSTLCLIQIFYDENCYLIDPLAKDINLDGIFKIIENPEVIKIVFAFGEDLRLLHLYGCKPNNVFDIATLSRLLDYPALSLTNLLLEKLEIETSKSSQLSDWFKRPLTEKQASYAAEDVLYLFQLKEALMAEKKFSLVEEWLGEEGLLINNFIYDATADKEFLKRKDKIKMNEFDWFVFSQLMTWREETAEKFNKPSHFIMPTDLIKEIVETPKTVKRWTSLPRIYSRIKNPKFANILNELVASALKEATEFGLSKNNKAIPSIAPEQRRKNRENRAIQDKLKSTVFKPIQGDMIEAIGENATNFVFSNKVILSVLVGDGENLPLYRRKLIWKSANKLKLDVEPFLSQV